MDMESPGWPRVLGYQSEARMSIPSGDLITSEMTPLVAQMYATLALSEAIMAMSSDVCQALGGIHNNIGACANTLDNIYAAVSSLPGAS